MTPQTQTCICEFHPALSGYGVCWAVDSLHPAAVSLECWVNLSSDRQSSEACMLGGRSGGNMDGDASHPVVCHHWCRHGRSGMHVKTLSIWTDSLGVATSELDQWAPRELASTRWRPLRPRRRGHRLLLYTTGRGWRDAAGQAAVLNAWQPGGQRCDHEVPARRVAPCGGVCTRGCHTDTGAEADSAGTACRSSSATGPSPQHITLKPQPADVAEPERAHPHDQVQACLHALAGGCMAVGLPTAARRVDARGTVPAASCDICRRVDHLRIAGCGWVCDVRRHVSADTSPG